MENKFHLADLILLLSRLIELMKLGALLIGWDQGFSGLHKGRSYKPPAN